MNKIFNIAVYVNPFDLQKLNSSSVLILASHVTIGPAGHAHISAVFF